MARLQLRSSAAFLEPRAKSDGVEPRLLQAAEAGDAHAQCNLGVLYGNGLDDNGYAVTGNRPQAVKWLLASAEQGLPRAQVKLAELYADGPDSLRSHATACGWFLLAAQRLRGVHLHRARSGYARIAANLTPEQIAQARRFAQDWIQPRIVHQNILTEEVRNEGLVRSANRHPRCDRHRPGAVRLASTISLKARAL